MVTNSLSKLRHQTLKSAKKAEKTQTKQNKTKNDDYFICSLKKHLIRHYDNVVIMKTLS